MRSTKSHQDTSRQNVYCVFGRFGVLSPGLIDCSDPSRDFGVQWWIYVLSIVTNRRKNSFGLRLKQATVCSEVVAQIRFWSIVSNSGTHFAQSFLMHKCACKILTTRSVEMDTISVISRNFTFGSFKTISWILLIISRAVISFGRPGLGMVFVLL